jgi:hypothetical protein
MERLFIDDALLLSTAWIYLSIDKRLPWGMLVSPVKLFIKALQCANESTLRHIELMRSTPPLCSACFVFMGLVSTAVDTELHARLDSRTGIHFISLRLKVSR